jgi:hypothetical protein
MNGLRYGEPFKLRSSTSDKYLTIGDIDTFTMERFYNFPKSDGSLVEFGRDNLLEPVGNGNINYKILTPDLEFRSNIPTEKDRINIRLHSDGIVIGFASLIIYTTHDRVMTGSLNGIDNSLSNNWIWKVEPIESWEKTITHMPNKVGYGLFLFCIACVLYLMYKNCRVNKYATFRNS